MDSYLDALENDLKSNVDRTVELDNLTSLVRSEDPEIREKSSWCVAKMGQNKIKDNRIVEILLPLVFDTTPDVRENVAWGIGEVAGAGIGDERCTQCITLLLSDVKSNVRGMAAWAAGRLIHKLKIFDEKMMAALESLKNDASEYVRNSVKFALS